MCTIKYLLKLLLLISSLTFSSCGLIDDEDANPQKVESSLKVEDSPGKGD
ncbi:hypothetical protein Q4534_07155 [Cyclobacterium sp. 1_MG-2023]|nr:hypothetical protein [Cyclobacterium sp. 1_MG-2023]MDO6437175.1 hypothetical protein [Cyclobacterium sp. 1_MG-2023]